MGTSMQQVGWVAMVVLASGTSFAGEAAETRAENQSTEDQSMGHVATPAEFEARVQQAQGRVNYVFGDDRPFVQCHASTIVQTQDGSLCCAWFGGIKEKDPGVAIWMSRFVDGKWLPCTRAAKVNDTAHWNPVLFRDPGRGLYLFFKVGPLIPSWRTYWMRSVDNGVTWSDPIELVPGDEGGRGPVKNKPILLSDGAWLAPASTEAGAWRCFVDRSEDGGKTWSRSADFDAGTVEPPRKGIIQPTLWESAPGKVHALMRSDGGRVVRADSEDGGRTWKPAYETSLPNNNSGIDVMRLRNGRLLLAYNPVSENWGLRTPLDLAISKDNGTTWKTLAHLEDEEGEYSYPAIVETSEGVAVSYTWRRERIRCWQIPSNVLSE